MSAPTDKLPLSKNINEDSHSHKTLLNKLPDLLRLSGAIAVLFAMYSFLVQGWDSVSDLYRYISLLGFTGVVALIGLLSSRWLKEYKGARMLLGLALVAVPANFAILGAFVFDYLHPGASALVPEYVTWQADSLGSLALMLSGAIFLLVPVVFMGFRVFASSFVSQLSVLYLISSAMILLPFRDPLVTGLILLAMLFITFYVLKRLLKEQTLFNTKEGMLAALIQFLPLGIIAGRSIVFYTFDFFQIVMLAFMAYCFLRQFAMCLERQSAIRKLLSKLMILPIFVFGIFLLPAVGNVGVIPEWVILPLVSFLTAIMFYDASIQADVYSSRYRVLGVIVVVSGFLLNVFSVGGMGGALIALLSGAILISLGYVQRQQSVLLGGLLLSGVGVMYQLFQISFDFDLANWSMLAVIGVLVIFLASMLESRGSHFRARLGAAKLHFSQWDK